MARTPRHASGTDWHHVMNRGARRLSIFGDAADRRSFLDRLDEAHVDLGIEIHAYALMTNHFHLLVRAPVDVLAASLQLITGRHAQRHNAKYGLDGPLFRGRYRSQPIVDERHLRHAIRYIHRNPIEHAAGPTTPGRLTWTSHPAYAGQVGVPRWLRVDPLLASQFGGRVETYERFVFGPEPPSPYCPPTERLTDTPRPLGMLDVERALGVESEAERDLLRRGGRGVRNDARLAAVHLAHEFVTNDVDRIGERFGFSSGSTVRSALSRARALLNRDAGFEDLVQRARLRLVGVTRAAGLENGQASDPMSKLGR